MSGDSSVRFYKVYIDGKPQEETRISVVTAIMRMHVTYYVPTLDMEVYDPIDFFSGLPVTDGIDIDVTLGDNEEVVYSFNLFKLNKRVLSQVNLYSISAIMSSTRKFLLTRTRKTYTGTVNEVTASILDDCGVKHDMRETCIGSRSWWGENKTHAELVHKNVLPQAKSSPNSLIMTGTSFYNGGLFILTDAIKEISKPKPLKLSNRPSEGVDILASEFKFASDSGFQNAKSGYTTETMSTDTVNGVTNILSETQALASGSVNIDQRFKDLSHVEVSPLNVGNYDKDHVEARHQNMRIKSLFNVQLEVLSRLVTKIDLFDKVEVDFTGPGKSITGDMILIGKGLVSRENEYAEKLCFVSNVPLVHSTRPD